MRVRCHSAPVCGNSLVQRSTCVQACDLSISPGNLVSDLQSLVFKPDSLGVASKSVLSHGESPAICLDKTTAPTHVFTNLPPP